MRFFKKSKKVWFTTALIFFSLFFLFIKWLQSYTEKLLGQALVALLSRETKGVYAMQYEDLQFEIFNNQLALTNLDIAPKNIAIPSNSNWYYVKVKSITLETEGLWQIYFTRELKIIGLTFIRPHIEIKNFTNQQGKLPTFSRQTGNLYLLIKNYVDRFQIKHFALYQASLAFAYRHNNRLMDYHFKHINFALQNVVIDSAYAGKRKKIFYADGFELSIDGQEITLPDSLHSFTFDKLEISTQKSSITFRNFHLWPRRSSPTRNDLYRMSVPELSLQGIDFLQAYNNNHLKIGNLSIAKPHLAISRSGKKENWLPERTFIKMITTAFDSVTIQNFHLQEGAFTFSENHQVKLILPQVDFNLEFLAFALADTGARASFPKIKNAVLTLHQQCFFTTDSLYRVEAQWLQVNFQPAYLQAKGIAIRKRQGYSWQNLLLADSITLQVSHWKAVTQTSTAQLDYVSIIRPIAYVDDFSRQEIFSGKWSKKRTKSVKIAHLQIKQGNAAIYLPQKQLELSKYYLQAENVCFSSGMLNNKAFISTLSCKLSAEKLTWQDAQHAIGLTPVRFRVKKGFAWLQGSLAFAQIDRNNFKASAKTYSFDLARLHLENLLERELIAFDTLHLAEAHLQAHLSVAKPYSHPFYFPLKGVITFDRSKIALEGSEGNFATFSNASGMLVFRLDSLPTFKFTTKQIQLAYDQLRINGDDLLADSQKDTLAIGKLLVSNAEDDSAIAQIENFALQGWNPNAWKHKHLEINLLQMENIQAYWKATGLANQYWDSLTIHRLAISGKDISLKLPKSAFQVHQFKGVVSKLTISDKEFGIEAVETFWTKAVQVELPNWTAKFDWAKLEEENDKHLTFKNLQLSTSTAKAIFHSAALTFPLWRWRPNHWLAQSRLQLSQGTIDLAENAFSSTLGTGTALPFQIAIENAQLAGNRLCGKLHRLHILQPAEKNALPEVLLQAEKITWHLPNQREFIYVNKLFHDPKNNRLNADSVYLQPTLSIEEFYKQHPFRRSYNHYQAGQVMLDSLRWDDLLSGKGIIATSACIDRLKCYVWLDKNVPPWQGTRLFPLDKLKQIRLPLRIDTVKLLQGEVSYREKTQRHEIAALEFTHLQGKLFGLNSQPKENDITVLQLKGKPEGRGNIDLDAFFDITSDSGQHRLEAFFDTIPLTAFNHFAEPLAGVHIKSGQISSGSIAVNANYRYAKGKIWLYYDHLKFTILSRKVNEQDETVIRRSPLMSIVANTLIRNKNRRIRLYKGKSGYISIAHQADKSLFSYWGRIALSGMMSSIGISPHLQEKWQRQMKERLSSH